MYFDFYTLVHILRKYCFYIEAVSPPLQYCKIKVDLPF